MYIVAIAWLFVVALLALTQASAGAALLHLIFWGVIPLSLLLWLLGTPERRRRRARENAHEISNAQVPHQDAQTPPEEK